MEIELTLPEDRIGDPTREETPAPTTNSSEERNNPSRINLPTLLRALGAVVVAISLSAFLFQGWEAGNDLQRYLMLLGQTGLLALLGVGCGRLLRETKGARTFLSLALLAVPVNFAILGALHYSTYASGLNLPEELTWRAAAPLEVLIAGGLALPVLSMVTLFALLVLARRSAKALGITFVALNALLLLPTRDPQLIVWLLVAATATALIAVRHIGRDDPARLTLEGVFARAVLFLPAMILAGRSLWLHHADDLLLTGGSLSLFLLLRAVTVELPTTSAWRRFLETLSLIAAALTALSTVEIFDHLELLGSELLLTAPLLIFSGLLFELSSRAANPLPYRRLAALVAGGGLAMNLVLVGGLLNAFIALALGAILLAYGFAIRQRVVAISSLISTGGGLLYLLGEMVTLFHIGTWGGLAVLGAAAIIAASLIERHGERLRAKGSGWRQRLADWEV